MTLYEIKNKLRAARVTIAREDGEYRVNLKGGREATAYYTTDLDDAYATGMAMAKKNQEENKHLGRFLALVVGGLFLAGAIGNWIDPSPPHTPSLDQTQASVCDDWAMHDPDDQAQRERERSSVWMNCKLRFCQEAASLPASPELYSLCGDAVDRYCYKKTMTIENGAFDVSADGSEPPDEDRLVRLIK